VVKLLKGKTTAFVLPAIWLEAPDHLKILYMCLMKMGWGEVGEFGEQYNNLTLTITKKKKKKTVCYKFGVIFLR
jgi:hypothetical protein